MFSKMRLVIAVICIISISTCVFAIEQSLFKESSREYLDKKAKFRIWLPDGWQMISRETQPNVITVGFADTLKQNSPSINVGWSLMIDTEGLLEYYTISYLREFYTIPREWAMNL